MKKKVISAAVLLGLAGASTAMRVNPDGLGQVLLFPYYTTNDGKTTNITIINTTEKAKAVKVRLKRGADGQSALNFNLYLQPYDTWTGGLSQNTASNPVMYTEDKSCTVPSFAEHDSAVSGMPLSGGGNEGQLEVIEMGVVGDEIAKDCQKRWAAGGDWTTDTQKDVESPEGGLIGQAVIIDVDKGIGRSYDATAIQDFFDETKQGGIAHAAPRSDYPNLNGEIAEGRSVGSITANYIDDNADTLVAARLPRTVDALSTILQANSLSNTFDASSGAATDWVISSPTKPWYPNIKSVTYSIDLYNTSGATTTTECVPGSTGSSSREATKPSTTSSVFAPALAAIGWFDGTESQTSGESATTECAPGSAGSSSREATKPSMTSSVFAPALAAIGWSDGTESQPKSEGEKATTKSGTGTSERQATPEKSSQEGTFERPVNILQFSNNSVLSSSLADKLSKTTTGWARLTFKTDFPVPVIGFSAQYSPSTLSDYGSLYNHKYIRRMSN